MKTKFQSFARRLTRRIILVMMLTMAVVSGIVYIFSTSGTMTMMEDHYQDILKMTDERVEGVLRIVEVSSANNVDEIRRHLGDTERLFSALENELRLNPHIVGCGISFVPNYFPDKGRWYEPYASRQADGSISVKQIGSASHDYFRTEWYIKGIQSENGYWSDPYYDDSGARAMLCSYVLPVRDSDGRIVAAFGADLTLEWLSKQVGELNLDSGNFGFLDESALDYSTTLFLYTDGLTEAENERHELFGMDRTLETAGMEGNVSPSMFIASVTTTVRSFVAGAVQSDDLTMLAIRYTGKSAH